MAYIGGFWSEADCKEKCEKLFQKSSKNDWGCGSSGRA
jgi:hypothetical protein